MIRQQILILLLCILPSGLLPAQTSDSLRTRLSATKDPSSKADLLIQLSNSYRYSSPDSSAIYARQASALLSSLKDSVRLVDADIFICYYYYNTGRADSGLLLSQHYINLSLIHI